MAIVYVILGSLLFWSYKTDMKRVKKSLSQGKQPYAIDAFNHRHPGYNPHNKVSFSNSIYNGNGSYGSYTVSRPKNDK
jgi:hypothetical protein